MFQFTYFALLVCYVLLVCYCLLCCLACDRHDVVDTVNKLQPGIEFIYCHVLYFSSPAVGIYILNNGGQHDRVVSPSGCR